MQSGIHGSPFALLVVTKNSKICIHMRELTKKGGTWKLGYPISAL